jgi:microcystin-dependent protein
MTVLAGTVIPYSGTSAPSGYVLCYGQAINRTTYATLFAVIGTTYGSGDGSTTFNVPDLRGRAVAGKDNMGGSAASRLTNTTMSPDANTLGATGGAQTHTLVTAEMPSHTHTIYNNDFDDPASSGGGRVSNTTGNADVTSAPTGGGAAHNNVQPTLILNYIIATEDNGGSLNLAIVKTISSLRG